MHLFRRIIFKWDLLFEKYGLLNLEVGWCQELFAQHFAGSRSQLSGESRALIGGQAIGHGLTLRVQNFGLRIISTFFEGTADG